MSAATLRLAVVGHTNVGKTSLLRTLARRPDFGTVADAPATTRRAEALTVFDGGAAGTVTLIDTPGLERASELLDALEQASSDGRHDRLAALTRLLDTPAHARAFEQEARVLAEAQAADALIVVLDAREPVLGKYRDELALLAACGRPLVALLNFTAQPDAREAAWRTALAAAGQHLVVAFDVVVADWPAERALHERLRVLLPAHAALFDALIAERAEARDWRRDSGTRLLAATVLAMAAHEWCVPRDDAARREAAIAESRDWARARETALAQALVRLHGHDLGLAALPDDRVDADGRWAADLFAPETLLRHGAGGLGPIAGGALAGAAIDAAVGGLSMGTGALLGAAGGTAVALRNPLKLGWRRMVGGEDTVQIGDDALRAVLIRNLGLLRALSRRGHAAVSALTPDAESTSAERLWRTVRGDLLAVRSGGPATVDTPETAQPKRLAAIAAALATALPVDR